MFKITPPPRLLNSENTSSILLKTILGTNYKMYKSICKQYVIEYILKNRIRSNNFKQTTNRIVSVYRLWLL